MTSYNLKIVTYKVNGEQDVITYRSAITGRKKLNEVDEEENEFMKEFNAKCADIIAESKKEKVLKPPERTPEELLDKARHSLKTSEDRTKQRVYDYGRANEWDWFLTFTFSKEKVNRYDYKELTAKLSVWLNNTRKKAPDMQYVVVPERHKDGAYHFHGLFSNMPEIKFVDSGIKDKKGKKVYNLPAYKWGFTTATKIRDSLKASSYITKYLTKDLMSHTKGKRRYWNSKNLLRGEVVTELLDYYGLKAIQETYGNGKSKRQKKVKVKRPDFNQEVNYYTIAYDDNIQ